MPQNKNKTKITQKPSTGTPSMQQLTAAIKKALPAPKQKNNKPQPKKKQGQSVMSVAAPVSIGTTVRGLEQSISYGKDSVKITGRDFACSVGETNQTNWYLGALIPVNPMFFSNTALGRLGQCYRYFRFKRLVAHFVTRQPTSSTGEIILVHHPNAAKELYLSTASTFLPRVMSTKASIMGPVWTNHSLPLKVSNTFMEVDALSTSDIDDNILGELVVYVQSGITDVVGYILLDYEIEFKEMYVNEQAQYMPLNTMFENATTQDAANNVAGAQMETVIPTVLNYYSQGTIFKAVLNATGTTFAAGTTANTAIKITNRTNSAAIACLDGVTFYAVVIGSNLQWYTTLDAAATQTDTMFVSYGLGVAAKSTWAFTFWVIQWGPQIKA